MDIQISGKNLDLGEALQTHVRDNLSERVHKYFERGVEAQVTFANEHSMVECEVVTHLASGVYLAARGKGGDAYSAFSEALEKIDKRVRRHKRRLKDHHNDVKAPLPAENASHYLLASPPEEEAAENEIEDGPIVIAEGKQAVREMTVSDAVMQLDVGEDPALMFKNAAHGRLNVIYRRADGHIGWIDPA